MIRHQPMSPWLLVAAVLLLVAFGAWALVAYATPTRPRPADLTATPMEARP